MTHYVSGETLKPTHSVIANYEKLWQNHKPCSICGTVLLRRQAV